MGDERIVVVVWYHIDRLEMPQMQRPSRHVYGTLLPYCTDDLDFSTRQWWLKNGSSIDGTSAEPAPMTV